MSLFQSAINATCVSAEIKFLLACEESATSAADRLLPYEVIFFIASSALFVWAAGYQVVLHQVKPLERDVRLMELGESPKITLTSRAHVVARRTNAAIVPVVFALVLLTAGIGVQQIRDLFSHENCQRISDQFVSGCEWGLGKAVESFLGGFRG